jgi:hypothetical protein
MNPQNPFAPDSASVENGSRSASIDETLRETLRLIATLPAPEGLEERIHAGVRAGLLADSSTAAKADLHSGRLLLWPARLRVESSWWHSAGMRAAAAAAIVCVVLGGGWGILSRVPTAQPQTAVSQPHRPSLSGGFSSAGAIRTPQTLNGPVVAQPVEIQPTAKAAHPRHRGKSADVAIVPSVK